MKAYSQDLRDKVIQAHKEDNLNSIKLAKQFKIHSSTIRRWINRYKDTGSYCSNQGVNCGRRISFTNRQAIMDILYKYPKANGIIVRNTLAPNIPLSTFYGILAKLEIPYKETN